MFYSIPLLLFFTCLFLMFQPAKSQQLQYEIVWKDDSIGYLTADKELQKGGAYYEIESSVLFKFIASVKLDFYFENLFQDGTLQKAQTKNLMNDKLRASSEISWTGQQYQTTVDEETAVLNQKIKHTMTTLYYNEPKNINHVFSERYAEFCAIRPLGKGKYELTLPTGKKNYYSYQNGICTHVEVNHTLATFYFKLKKVIRT